MLPLAKYSALERRNKREVQPTSAPSRKRHFVRKCLEKTPGVPLRLKSPLKRLRSIVCSGQFFGFFYVIGMSFMERVIFRYDSDCFFMVKSFLCKNCVLLLYKHMREVVCKEKIENMKLSEKYLTAVESYLYDNQGDYEWKNLT